MRRQSASLMPRRLTAIIVIILGLAACVVLGQGDGEKTCDDAMRLLEQARNAHGRALR